MFARRLGLRRKARVLAVSLRCAGQAVTTGKQAQLGQCAAWWKPHRTTRPPAVGPSAEPAIGDPAGVSHNARRSCRGARPQGAGRGRHLGTARTALLSSVSEYEATKMRVAAARHGPPARRRTIDVSEPS